MGGGAGGSWLPFLGRGSYHRRAPQMDCGREEELDKWEEGKEDGLLTRFSFCSDKEFRPRGQAGKQAGPRPEQMHY